MSFNFNLYDELEVNKKATQEEIKKAYRKLAMVFKIYFNIRNGIRIKIKMTTQPQKNSKEFRILTQVKLYHLNIFLF